MLVAWQVEDTTLILAEDEGWCFVLASIVSILKGFSYMVRQCHSQFLSTNASNVKGYKKPRSNGRQQFENYSDFSPVICHLKQLTPTNIHVVDLIEAMTASKKGLWQRNRHSAHFLVSESLSLKMRGDMIPHQMCSYAWVNFFLRNTK